jgi:hypothetical protein
LRKSTFLLSTLVALLAAVIAYLAWPPKPLIPSFSTPVGKYRQPLPYRIVSFHRGRADKNLILLAHHLGFTGVQFQIEGPNVSGLLDFAQRDAQEHLVDYCHSLGMNVTLWVHELSDLPGPWLPDDPGPVSANNEKLWTYLAGRYEWLLTSVVPTIDGLVLTVVETDVNATDAPLMKRVVATLRQACDAHHKSLTVRTFVWTPDQFDSVMAAVRALPDDSPIMSKIVPQDWQMRGAHAAELGAVGPKQQIVEFDAHGEYFLRDSVANCMVPLLKKQFDYAVSKGADGICVRVDRDDASLLFTPNEVNLWALGMLASGAANSEDQIWSAFLHTRYNDKAAPALRRALDPTGEVVAELLSIGPFTFGDTRLFPPPLPSEDPFDQNWQNWKWDKSYAKTHSDAERGDPSFIEKVAQQKAAAAQSAIQSLADLEAAKPDLPDIEYDILQSKLLSNRLQLAIRTPMALATLHYRAYKFGPAANREAARQACFADLATLRTAATALPTPGDVISYKQRPWRIPDTPDRDATYKWLYDASKLLPQNP